MCNSQFFSTSSALKRVKARPFPALHHPENFASNEIRSFAEVHYHGNTDFPTQEDEDRSFEMLRFLNNPSSQSQLNNIQPFSALYYPRACTFGPAVCTDSAPPVKVFSDNGNRWETTVHMVQVFKRMIRKPKHEWTNADMQFIVNQLSGVAEVAWVDGEHEINQTWKVFYNEIRSKASENVDFCAAL